MISGIFITKLTNVSAFWRRKFRRSPRLQYSVITSTGPEDETLPVTTLLENKRSHVRMIPHSNWLTETLQFHFMFT